MDGLSATSNPITATVAQVLTRLVISPSTVTLAPGAQQLLTVQGTDQFSQTMILVGSVSWSTNVGSFSGATNLTAVAYVAPAAAANGMIAVRNGALQSSVSVTVVTASDLQDPALALLTQSLDADGSISRADMIQILRKVENLNGGVLNSGDFTDLKTILGDATTLNIPGYVQVLAGDIINGSVANASYLGQMLGNLAVGSSSVQLEKLVQKWFYGADLPATGGLAYDTGTAGTLFGPSGPSHLNEYQGELGDCYLISGLGTIADSSQQAIKNMFLDNGDGTWTVRFYTSTGTADYVTVNSRLPVYYNYLVFDGGTYANNPSNVLWIELAEKAYAQWNETGNTGQSVTLNNYFAIEGGWMSDVYTQVLGHAATDYRGDLTTFPTAQQAMIDAVVGHKAVTVGTMFDDPSTLLYGSHAYAVIGYNAANGKFTLYNPWGMDQPTPMSWAKILQDCDDIAIADPSGSTSFGTSVSTKLSASSIGLTVARMGLAGVPVSLSNVSPGADTPAVAAQKPAALAASIVDKLLASHGTSANGASELSETGVRRWGTQRLVTDSVAGSNNDLLPAGLFTLAADQWADSVSALQRAETAGFVD